MEQFSSLKKEVYTRQEIVVPRKHVMSYLMLGLKETEIKAEAIPVHMHHKHTVTKQLKNKGEITTGTVHAGQINKTTTLTLPTKEGPWCSKPISLDHGRYKLMLRTNLDQLAGSTICQVDHRGGGGGPEPLREWHGENRRYGRDGEGQDTG